MRLCDNRKRYFLWPSWRRDRHSAKAERHLLSKKDTLFVQEIADQVRNDGIGYGSCQLNNSQLNNWTTPNSQLLSTLNSQLSTLNSPTPSPTIWWPVTIASVMPTACAARKPAKRPPICSCVMAPRPSVSFSIVAIVWCTFRINLYLCSLY